MKRTFYVRAIWDPEVNKYYTESDIIGLHIETKTLDEFEEVMNEFAGELVLENHWRKEQVPEDLIKTTVPIILWQRPKLERHAA